MPNSLDQNGVGFPAGKPPGYNYPRTGEFQTSTPQTAMYPRSANHFWKLIDCTIQDFNPLNFLELQLSGTWFEVNAWYPLNDQTVFDLALFVKLNNPMGFDGDGFFGSIYNPLVTTTPNRKPICVRGIPFDKIYFGLLGVSFSEMFYLSLSYGTDTDLNRVDVR